MHRGVQRMPPSITTTREGNMQAVHESEYATEVLTAAEAAQM